MNIEKGHGKMDAYHILGRIRKSRHPFKRLRRWWFYCAENGGAGGTERQESRFLEIDLLQLRLMDRNYFEKCRILKEAKKQIKN